MACKTFGTSLASAKAVPIATQQSHCATHESNDRVVLEIDISIYATHRDHRLEDRDKVSSKTNKSTSRCRLVLNQRMTRLWHASISRLIERCCWSWICFWFRCVVQCEKSHVVLNSESWPCTLGIWLRSWIDPTSAMQELLDFRKI